MTEWVLVKCGIGVRETDVFYSINGIPLPFPLDLAPNGGQLSITQEQAATLMDLIEQTGGDVIDYIRERMPGGKN